MNFKFKRTRQRFSVLSPRDSTALSSWSLEPGTLHLPPQINAEILLMDVCSQILYKNAFISLREKSLQSSSKFSVSGKGRIKGDTWGEVGAQTTPLRAWSHTQLPRSHFSLSQAGSRPLAYLDNCSLTQQKLATYWQVWTATFQKVLGSASLAAGHWQQPCSSLSHSLLLKQQPKLRGSYPSSHPFLKICRLTRHLL